MRTDQKVLYLNLEFGNIKLNQIKKHLQRDMIISCYSSPPRWIDYLVSAIASIH